MAWSDEITREIFPSEEAYEIACRRHWNGLCKPLGGLGILEDIVASIGGMQRTIHPHCSRKAIVIMGADNGVVCEGVSQTGSEVTAQVLENMGNDITSVCVLARAAGAEVFPVNIGMNVPARHPRVRNVPVRAGTGNIAKGPAMTPGECMQAIMTGREIALELASRGYDLLAAGEMGIGNTTTSAACACVLFDLSPEMAAGRGAGLSGEGLENKIRAVREAIRANAPDPGDPIDIISGIGGLDIAGMAGLYLGGAQAQIPVLIDGVISGVAAVLAGMIAPASTDYMIATHMSSEPAGEYIMRTLKKKPFLYAGMHLGEGTGAAVSLPLIDAALKVYYELPSFAEGNVKQYEDYR